MKPIATDRARWRAALLLMLASGYAGLGYQIVWTRQCALWLGHEAAAVLAVITAFFGGLAVGALLLAARIERSPRPARWYAGCEALIALWSLLLVFAMSPFGTWIVAITGSEPSPLRHLSLAFIGTFLLLLPATAAMGATLPAMARAIASLRPDARAIAPLYAANTFGAVVGVLAIAFWLAPTLGLRHTALLCIALNLLCALAALRLFDRDVSAAVAKPDARDGTSPIRGLLPRFALSGLLGIGYEVLVARVLSQVAQDTVYTYALLLAVYLVGSAAGAAGYARWQARDSDWQRNSDRLSSALAIACLLGTASLWGAVRIADAAQRLLGTGMAQALAGEALLALAAFGPPTLLMGALFSHLAAGARSSGLAFGRALGINTLAAAAAPILFGVLAFPTLGPKFALLIVGAGYLLLLPWQRWRSPLAVAPAALALLIALWAPPLAFVDIPEGGRLLSYRDGVMAAVSVVEDADGVARLRIDNRQQEGTSATRRVDARQAWLPALLHPAPRQALFLGLGTGVTSSAAADDPALNVEVAELLPEVIAASQLFVPERRIHIVAADARRYVRATSRRYDLIVSDNFHPARSGSGALYTVEHFAAARARLEMQGLFCQWLPLHQLDLETLRSIVQSFLSVYPQGLALLANNSLQTPVLGLIGQRGDGRFAFDEVDARVAQAFTPQKLAELGLDDAWAVLGSFVAGPAALRRFAGDAPANTDDRPVVAYRAPRITYAPDSSPDQRLIALLQALSISPDDVLANDRDRSTAQRLAAYWQARDLFIASGRGVRPTANVRNLLAQVREPLLATLRISPDFRPAYDPLLAMARRLADENPLEAGALLRELTALAPARPEAAAALTQLHATAR